LHFGHNLLALSLDYVDQDAVRAGTPLVAVGAALDLVVFDCPSFLFVLADDPGIVVVG